MQSLLQIATFSEFSGWLFGAIFFALMGLFWYWVSHNVTEMNDNIKELNERINMLEKIQVRLEEQLAALRKEVSSSIAGQRKFFYNIRKGYDGVHDDCATAD